MEVGQADIWQGTKPVISPGMERCHQVAAEWSQASVGAPQAMRGSGMGAAWELSWAERGHLTCVCV